jgi:hypothetical protein
LSGGIAARHGGYGLGFIDCSGGAAFRWLGRLDRRRQSCGGVGDAGLIAVILPSFSFLSFFSVLPVVVYLGRRQGSSTDETWRQGRRLGLNLFFFFNPVLFFSSFFVTAR